MKKGILLINLGTPDGCDPKSVYRYLKEFLNDARVIDLPFVLRWILVNGLILPFRYKKSARAYQKIWLPEGSPLLVHSMRLKQALADHLGADYQVELGMRYGSPSIDAALLSLKACHQIMILPLFPQYACASTGSAMAVVLQQLSKQWNIPHLQGCSDFYQHSGFIAAYVEVIQDALANKTVDKLLFSYHGLPERHVRKSGCRADCDLINACPIPSDANAFCYRAQCYATSRLLAQGLGLAPHQYAVAFQSRLGRTPWIKPYTDVLLPELAEQGVKNLAIACPAFVADCLETLEEIDMRAREQWLSLGGETFTFIPCLNAHPTWIAALGEMVRL